MYIYNIGYSCLGRCGCAFGTVHGIVGSPGVLSLSSEGMGRTVPTDFSIALSFP